MRGKKNDVGSEFSRFPTNLKNIGMCGLAEPGVLYIEQWPGEKLVVVSFTPKSFINLDTCAEPRHVTVP